MNMREKIARAIAKSNRDYERNFDAYLIQADAALEAMREPTDEMVISAGTIISDNLSEIEKGYTAMIDAAREGK